MLGCTLEVGNLTFDCAPAVNGSTVAVEVPGEVLRGMNRAGLWEVRLRLVLNLSRGVLEGWPYPIHVSFAPPSVEVSGGVVAIRNPNPFCLDANVTVLWADAAGRPWNATAGPGCIPPGATELDLRGYRYAY